MEAISNSLAGSDKSFEWLTWDNAEMTGTVMSIPSRELIPENIKELLQSDQPTTLVYPQGKGLANGVISQNGSVAIRIPKPCFALDLISAFGKPLVSTSANLSGKPIPAAYSEIDPYILAHVDEIVPLEKDRIASVPSRVLLLNPDGTVKPLR